MWWWFGLFFYQPSTIKENKETGNSTIQERIGRASSNNGAGNYWRAGMHRTAVPCARPHVCLIDKANKREAGPEFKETLMQFFWKKKNIKNWKKRRRRRRKNDRDMYFFSSSSLHSVPSQLRSLCPLLSHHRAQSATDIGSLFETNRLNYTGLAAIFFLFRGKKRRQERKKRE